MQCARARPPAARAYVRAGAVVTSRLIRIDLWKRRARAHACNSHIPRARDAYSGGLPTLYVRARGECMFVCAQKERNTCQTAAAVNILIVTFARQLLVPVTMTTTTTMPLLRVFPNRHWYNAFAPVAVRQPHVHACACVCGVLHFMCSGAPTEDWHNSSKCLLVYRCHFVCDAARRVWVCDRPDFHYVPKTPPLGVRHDRYARARAFAFDARARVIWVTCVCTCSLVDVCVDGRQHLQTQWDTGSLNMDNLRKCLTMHDIKPLLGSRQWTNEQSEFMLKPQNQSYIFLALGLSKSFILSCRALWWIIFVSR